MMTINAQKAFTLHLLTVKMVRAGRAGAETPNTPLAVPAKGGPVDA